MVAWLQYSIVVGVAFAPLTSAVSDMGVGVGIGMGIGAGIGVGIGIVMSPPSEVAEANATQDQVCLPAYVHTGRSTRTNASTAKTIEAVYESDHKHGSPACPCINASYPKASYPNHTCTTSDGTMGFIVPTGYASGECYPISYGLSKCVPHDETLPPSCWHEGIGDDGSTDTWCHKPWCFVDPQNCERPNHKSSFREGLSYSYETCGVRP